MHRTLRDKKILVTAGPTWVPIDSVRVISNISSGLTGITIAQHAASRGADVTLLLGPACIKDSLACRNRKPGQAKLKIVRFKYFDELKRIIERQLDEKKYDILIHTAAVSDYRPVKVFNGKIKSGKQELKIFLKPTLKLTDILKRNGRGAFLVMFKLEVKTSRKKLIDAAYKDMIRAGADLVVANNLEDINETSHKGYVIDLKKKVNSVATKKELADRLFQIILERL